MSGPTNKRSSTIRESKHIALPIFARGLTTPQIPLGGRGFELLDPASLVLDNLVKYETQNELLDIVRQMIGRQEQLIEQTKEAHEKQTLEGLFK